MSNCSAAALLALGVLASLSAQEPPAPSPPAELQSALQAVPDVAQTRDGRRGDPINVALVGTRGEVEAAFRAAGWFPAAPITVRSAVGISASVVFNVRYRRAPVSTLYLFGRAQDLAFEQLAGHSARSRHHVRLWCVGDGCDGRSQWVGAATFDVSVGRSSTTGRITHHIGSNVDCERDKIMADLRCCGLLERSFLMPHAQPRQDRNGEGDCYCTDGNLAVGVLRHVARPSRRRTSLPRAGRSVVPWRRVAGLPFRGGAAARNGKPSALLLPTPLRADN